MADNLTLSFVMDALMLGLLAVTIVYAARLSLYLKRFRDSKSDLQAVIMDLSKQIAKADEAIKGLDFAVQESAQDLKYRTDKAAAMLDELQMVVESGDSMASRLEALAVKNRKILEGDTGDLEELRRATASFDHDEYQTRLETVVRNVKAEEKSSKSEPESPVSIFNIRDMDIERGDDVVGGFTLDDSDDDVLSDAERDLYNALKIKKTKRGGV